MMQINAQQIAHIVNGTVEGNPEVLVSRPSAIEQGGEGTITFLANPKFIPFAYSTTASIILVSNDFVPTQTVTATLIRVENVRGAIATLMTKFGEQKPAISGISSLAFIHFEAKIGENVAIAPFVVIEKGVVIGANSVIHAQVFIGENANIAENVVLNSGVKIYHNCQVGKNVIIHANTVIGSDGFGFAPQADGTFQKIPQIGNVIIEDDVEIGANTVIDRAAMDSTIIRKGAKLDNLIQIAHNVEIGENTVIAAQAGIAGSTKIGKNNQIGGQAGVVGHISTADGVRVQAQSGINRRIKEEGKAVYGSPALAYNDYLRAYAIFKNLPALEKKVRNLEKKLEELK
jgi:UDP-3-O-[3-hydroxymyristoyl] glucosamine N-acyltransferase